MICCDLHCPRAQTFVCWHLSRIFKQHLRRSLSPLNELNLLEEEAVSSLQQTLGTSALYFALWLLQDYIRAGDNRTALKPIKTLKNIFCCCLSLPSLAHDSKMTNKM